MKIVCRCEDLSEEDIINLIKQGYTTIDEIKRFSRATMGHCQGRTCKRLIAQLIAKNTKIPIEKNKYPNIRPPIKPIALKIFKK